MDYSELVKDLRYCADSDTLCSECKWFNANCEQKLIAEAADAIEMLLMVWKSAEADHDKMMAFKDLAFKPPIYAIRVKSCGNDWVTDCDATLTADKVRGFALDSDGVKVYSRERDIHGDYDNIYVPYSNLEALIFYFNEPPKEETE